MMTGVLGEHTVMITNILETLWFKDGATIHLFARIFTMLTDMILGFRTNIFHKFDCIFSKFLLPSSAKPKLEALASGLAELSFIFVVHRPTPPPPRESTET